MNKIEKIFAEEIKDSRGNPTLKVTVWSGDKSDSFSVPSGASTGAHEANELRDEDGKSVNKAIKNVNEIIAPVLIGKDIENQKELDDILIELDGTKNKNKLGGNAIIGASIAIAKIAAKMKELEVYEYLQTLEKIKPTLRQSSGQAHTVPFLYINLINGGAHVLRSLGEAGHVSKSPSSSLGTSDKSLAFQEYHVVPDTQDVSEAVQIGITIQNTIKEIILEKYGKESLVLGDEGGYAPKITDIREPLVILSEAIEKNNLQNKARLALDVAASSFYENGFYKINEKKVNKTELLKIYKNLISEFNLLSIEDPFDEEDFESFAELKKQNSNLMVMGDDLTVTNMDRVKRAIEKDSINAMIIKPNQIGTLSETLATMKFARENDIELIVSHRSGETDDDFIADLAFAFGCYGLKSGAPSKPERKVKYDRLKLICQASHK